MSTKTILRTTASTLTYTGTTESPELFTNMTTTMSTRTTLTHTTTLINTKTTASSDAKSKSTSPTMIHSSSELNNISNSVEASISTQSLTGTDSVYSTLKLSTAIKSSSDLGTFSTTENTNGNSTFDQSTTRIGQRNKHSITSYQPTDTTMYRESRDEGISNPFTGKIGKLYILYIYNTHECLIQWKNNFQDISIRWVNNYRLIKRYHCHFIVFQDISYIYKCSILNMGLFY